MERSSYHYRGRRADQADLKKRVEEIASDARAIRLPSYPCAASTGGLGRERQADRSSLQEMGLQLRHRPPKRRVKAKLREGRCEAPCSNEVWAMDLVHDQLATGPKLRILTVVDTLRRFSPAVMPRFSFRAPDVVDVLERVCGEVGYRASIRVDQGSEFVSRELDLWAYTRGVVLDFSRPGKPTDNANTQVVQRQVPGRMCEPALVHELRRRGAQMRGLA